MLRRHDVGRIAYAFQDRVGIEPIHFVYDKGWIYGRTSPGSKLDTLAHHPWVAFEVDEVDGPLDWKSVVAKGTFYPASADGPPNERQAWSHAKDLITALAPTAFTPDDPVSFRHIVFHIFVDELTGRAASTTRKP